MSSPHLRPVDSKHVRQAWDTVVENALGLDRPVAERLVDALNDDLSGLYLLFNQVRKHYWLVEGAESGPVEDRLRNAADRLSAVTDDLAIRVHALGGVPVCGPMGMRQHAPMEIEAPHRYDVRSSLERDYEGYVTLCVQFREHVALAARLGDTGTSDLLRGHLLTLERDADTLARYLADDTLREVDRAGRRAAGRSS
jgi:DNA-binding ferritin-like protein